MEKIVLSLVLPVYNVERYIEKCLQSIVKQDLSQCEVVLVDDGSTDNSGNICDQYADAYKNFKVLHRTNRGLYQTRLDGAKLAVGQYVWFVDSDDWLMDCSIACLLNALDESGYPDVIMFGFCLSGEEKEKRNSTTNNGTCVKVDKKKAIYDLCTSESINSVWRKCFRRELISENEFLNEIDNFSFGEDTYITAAVFQKMQNIIFYNEDLYVYRKNPSSMTCKYNPDRLKDEEVSCHKLIELANMYEFSKELLPKINFRFLKELMFNVRCLIESDLCIEDKLLLIRNCMRDPFWGKLYEESDDTSLSNKEREIWRLLKLNGKKQEKKVKYIYWIHCIKKKIVNTIRLFYSM